jgi:hypothetical protein
VEGFGFIIQNPESSLCFVFAKEPGLTASRMKIREKMDKYAEREVISI